jgi:phage terminase large subunit GpA-like protein
MTKEKVYHKKKKRIPLVELLNGLSSSIVPPEELTLAAWSDKKRILPRASTAEHGQWRTSRFPYLQEVMDKLSPQDPTDQIAIMKGAQLGFTEVALNWMFYTIDHNPCPFLYVQKTIEAVEKFNRQRFNKSLESMPAIEAKLTVKHGRKLTNSTKRMKMFPGGIIILGGANSAASLRSMPIQYLVLDEEDSFEADIQEEGSPQELAIRRTANFPNRKVLRISTPTVKETSSIEPLFEEGDQRRYYVPCPECKHKDWIKWPNIKYVDDDPKTAELYCEKCGCLIPESKKTWMLENGEWVAENPGAPYPSYHISSLYSPLGFYSWADAVRLWLKAQKNFDKALLKVFVNTVLGETFTEAGKSIRAGWLEERLETYSADVPDGVLVLTAGCDVQDHMIACEILGWGAQEQSWSIAYETFMGDTEYRPVWEQLDLFLRRQWRHSSGQIIGVLSAAIDSGFRTKVVYDYCISREHMRFFPVKGRPGWGNGYIKRPTARSKEGVWLFIANVDELKSKVYSHLRVEEPGPGYCHFPRLQNYNDQFFKMLTAETLQSTRRGGRATLAWNLPKGRRNEALDCRCYNIAALSIMNVNLDMIAQMTKGKPFQLNTSAMMPSVAKARRARKHSSGIGE